MKKIGLLVLSVILTTGILAGCGSKATDTKNETATTTTQQTDASKTQEGTSDTKATSDSKTSSDSKSSSTVTPSADVHTDINEAAPGTTPKLDKLLEEDKANFNSDTISDEFIASHPWSTLDEYMDNHSDVFNFDQHMIQNNKYTKVSETKIVFHVQFFNNKTNDQSLQYVKDATVEYVNGKWKVTSVVDVNK